MAAPIARRRTRGSQGLALLGSCRRRRSVVLHIVTAPASQCGRLAVWPPAAPARRRASPGSTSEACSVGSGTAPPQRRGTVQQRFSRGPHLAPTASASNPDGPLHASAPPRPPPLVPPRIARAARRARERLSLVRERVEDRLETLLRHRPAARERTRSTRHHRRPPPPRAEGVRWLAVQRVPGARTARPEGGGFSDFSAAATFARSSSVALPSANFLPMPEEKPLYLQACTRRGTRSRSRSRPATRSRTTERAPPPPCMPHARRARRRGGRARAPMDSGARARANGSGARGRTARGASHRRCHLTSS